MLFFKANIGNIFLLLIAIYIYFFLKDIDTIPLYFIIILCYLDITIFNISFEYQRITLIISRIAKVAHNSNLSVPQLQILMTNNKIVPLLIIDAVIAGIIIGYFLHASLVFLLLYLIAKYLMGIFIPTYKPYALLFKYVGQELENKSIKSAHEILEKFLYRTLFFY
jgi:hypothetical protein